MFCRIHQPYQTTCDCLSGQWQLQWRAAEKKIQAAKQISGASSSTASAKQSTSSQFRCVYCIQPLRGTHKRKGSDCSGFPFGCDLLAKAHRASANDSVDRGRLKHQRDLTKLDNYLHT